MDLSPTKGTGWLFKDELKDLSMFFVFTGNGILIDDVARTNSYLDFTGLKRFLPVIPGKGIT